MTPAHHVIRVRSALLTDSPHIVADGHDWLAFCPNPVVAARIAQLLERHGLVDVPDHMEDE